MAEEIERVQARTGDIEIKKCAAGFLVKGSQYGGDELRAFSSPEGLIEWLSREIGCGPIVWALTLDIWAGVVGIGEDELLPVPDVMADPRRHQEALEDNAKIIFARFIEALMAEHEPKEKPKPKKKKARKPKEEKLEEEKGGSETPVLS